MIIFDKAAWHIDAGEDKDEVISKFDNIFAFLSENKLLSDDGTELYELGIDESCSLNDSMVTEEGSVFLEKNYDLVIEHSSEKIKNELNELYHKFTNSY